MKKLVLTISIISFIMIFFIGNIHLLAQDNERELNVSAAISLKEALTKIQTVYRQKVPGVKIIFNFGSSGALQMQIEQGVPCDLFISAAEKQMDAVEKIGFLQEGTRKIILRNQLVLIVPMDSGLNLKRVQDLTDDKIQKIAIGAPDSVPAGQYALEFLKYLGVWERIEPKTIQGVNVRAVLTYVETGNVDAGIVYKTDALISKKVKVILTAPPESHEPIVYPAAVLKKAKQPKEAREFLNYLTFSEARSIFGKYGFLAENR